MGIRNRDFPICEQVRNERAALILPRQAKALRILLGLSVPSAARLARVKASRVREFEREASRQDDWRHVSRQLGSVYRALGGGWFDDEYNEGAHCVFLAKAGADDRRAINSALALMGDHGLPKRRPVTVRELASRAGVTFAQLKPALAGHARLPGLMAAKCIYALGDHGSGAGCYFHRHNAGGWRLVGCDWQGCWW